MKVLARANRELVLINARNTQNENIVETIELEVPEKFEDFNKKIVFITDDGIVWDLFQNNEYRLQKAITKYKRVQFYIWLTKDDEDWRSQTKQLIFYDNEDASGEITPEEISGVNTVINLLEDEISKVERLDITAEKVGKVTTLTITDKDGTQTSYEILDGEDGEDGDDYVITPEDYQAIANIVLSSIVIPSKTSDLTNDSGFIDNTVNNLTNYYNKNQTYNKDEIDGKLASIYRYKGTVATYSDLPSTGLTVGDVYNVESDGSNYAWTGTQWDKLGGEVDLSGYYNKTQTDELLSGKVNNSQLNDYYTKTRTDELLGTKQNTISSNSKLDSDLVDDTNSSNKFVTTSEKSAWNNKLSQCINITYTELKALRDNSHLVKGQLYRIIDYVTTTALNNTNSAGHQFDIIVEALDTNNLSENARAIAHSGDTYYSNRDLEAWQLKYNLDNDTTKYDWADSTNGKGIIYYLKDDFNNECEYDHTNIRYKGSALYGYADIPVEANIDGNSYYYTFAKATEDMTNYERVQDNIVYDETTADGRIKKLPFNIMYSKSNIQIYKNIFKTQSSFNTIIVLNPSDNKGIACNIFENVVYGNLIIAKEFIRQNSFVRNVYSNKIVVGDIMLSNNFNNSFFRNTITIGTHIQASNFSDNVKDNIITVGTYVGEVNFRYNVYENVISTAENMSTCVFEYAVYKNTITSTNSKLVSLKLSMNTYRNVFESLNSITYTEFYKTNRCSLNNSTINTGLQYLKVEGIVGESDANKFDLMNSNLFYITAPKHIRLDATGNIICTWANNKDTITGIYKIGITDNTWKDITETYVKPTNYATDSVGGVIKVDSNNGLNVSSAGALRGATFNYNDYTEKADTIIISKGTLENVITGKDLTTKAYVDGLVGDLESILEELDVGGGI